MAIRGETPDVCFSKFRSPVAALVSKIVPSTYPVHCDRRGTKRTLSLVNPKAEDAIPIDTLGHGRIYFYMAQELTALPEGKRDFRLKTVAYRYKLFAQLPDLENSDALIRWEYERRKRPNGKWCPHHVQFGRVDGASIRPQLGTELLDLNKVHTPTGWVLIEDVFRFMVHELGMSPPCGDGWADVLHEFEDIFREFTSP